MAPEIIKGGEYDNRVDMWSLGVITYVMLCGFPPWEGESESDVFVNIMTLQYDFPSPEWDEISDHAKEFIRSLLSEHNERLRALKAMNHTWIKTYVPPIATFELCLPSAMYDIELIKNLKKHMDDTLKLSQSEMEIIEEKDKSIIKVSYYS